MTESKPMSPEEIMENKVVVIPSFVFDVVNNNLSRQIVSLNSTVHIKEKVIVQEIIDMAAELDNEVDVVKYRSAIYVDGWLNFEECYRAVGWNVEYDKPAYNESYDAVYKFSRNND